MSVINRNTKYQYLRLYDGKELFAMVKEVDNLLELHFPMNIMCKPAMSGGVTIHLGPFIPFTTDDTVIINPQDVVVRTSITDQFVGFYDEACTAWLDMRENDTIEIKSTKEDFQQQQKQLASLIKERLNKTDLWDEYPEEEDLFDYENLPEPNETIH
tara:strand:+ start:2424 stop:2894 length:471 start_codon:yes stop_codon:yes gene_type:complete